MEQTVYLDLYFLINFSMDILGLFLAARLLSYRVHAARCTLAAIFGALYACAALLLLPSGALGLLFDILACGAMSFIAIKRRGNLRQVGAYAIVCAAVSILLGGFMTALFSVLNRLGLNKIEGGSEVSDGLSVWLFALLAAISGAMSFFGGKIFKKRSARKYGKVQVRYGDRCATISALCDSGNMLREPISTRPCIVVDRRILKEILPRRSARLVEEGRIDELGGADAGRIRIIPTSTVSGDSLLYALRADSVSVDMGKGWCEIDAYIAFSTVELDGETRALIPSELVLGAP